MGCESRERTTTSSARPRLELVGTWHYDSAGAAFYDQRRHFSHRFMNPLPPGALLTIGPARWTYSGSVREEHTYVRHGNAVWVRRVVDTALVRGGHARAADMGQVLGRTDTLLLTTLTRHRLVLCDSTTDLDGSLTRVWRYYYSR
jgi:hypothetical protein